MSTLTTNLEFIKPDLTDNISPEAFNDNFDIIDEAIGTLQDRLTANSTPFRFGYDSERQKYGYVVEVDGADTVVPFKGAVSRVSLGTVSGTKTFNLTSYDGWEEFTNNNFALVGSSGSTSSSAGNPWASGDPGSASYNSASASASFSAGSLSYNTTTGILTVTSPKVSSISTFNSQWGGAPGSTSYGNVSSTVYLFYSS